MANISYISQGQPTAAVSGVPAINVDATSGTLYVSNPLTGAWVPAGSIFPIMALAANATVPANVPADYRITKTSAAAITLGAPTSGTADGTIITFTSNTAFAHVITATGLIFNGVSASALNTITFGVIPGIGVTLQAYAGKWTVMYSVGSLTYA